MFNFVINVQPAKDLLTNLRNKAETIRDSITADVKGPIQEHIQQDVDQFIAPYPENGAIHPFAFISDASRRWYFAHRRGVGRLGTFESQTWDRDDNSASWQRTDTLHDAWAVTVNPAFAAFRAGSSTYTITNTAVDELGRNYSDWVYSNKPQPGHAATGWGLTIADGVERVMDTLEYDLVNSLSNALFEYRGY